MSRIVRHFVRHFVVRLVVGALRRIAQLPPMNNYRALEQQLSSELGLTRRPVAITFVDAPPAGVSKFTGSVPSGCSFWRLASDGRVFFTAAE
jgi:hypothetical protein